MRTALPFIFVGLAILSAACVAYIAWELTSEDSEPGTSDTHKDARDQN